MIEQLVKIFDLLAAYPGWVRTLAFVWVAISGVLLVGLIAFRPPRPPVATEPQKIVLGDEVHGDKVENYSPPDQSHIREFRKFVPETYLGNLPRAKYNAYMDAHILWDTGVTAKMVKGNALLAERLTKILTDLAKTAYTPDYFEGQPVENYYAEKISLLMETSSEAQPRDGGTMHIVIASGDHAEIVDDFIERIVEDVTSPDSFSDWKIHWDRASELGAMGEELDLDITDKF